VVLNDLDGGPAEREIEGVINTQNRVLQGVLLFKATNPQYRQGFSWAARKGRTVARHEDRNGVWVLPPTR
jgi:hypothetical protein